MKFLYLGSHGPEDPTRAALPLHMARGAFEAGHAVEVVLQGDAALLFNDTIAANVQPVGLPSLRELFAFMGEKEIPVFG
jgi:predicted peroxiredoxin